MSSPHPSRRLLVAGALVVAAFTALTGCSAAAPAATPTATAKAASAIKPSTLTTVNVGITGATAPPTFLPLVAQKMGLDEKNNIMINFVTITPNVTAQTLSQGSIDILAAPSAEAATLQGAPFKIIAGAALSYWHLAAAKSITNWKDLAGKKIALPCGVGATCDAFIDAVLTAHKVNPASVTFINGTAQGTYDAMAAGSVDAALTTAPYTYALTTAGKTKEFDISSSKPYLSTQFTATTSYISKNPAVIAAFVQTMIEAEKILGALPVSSKVLNIVDAFETANGIDPTTLDQKRFLTDFATDKSWQLVPTKALIQRDLSLLAASSPTLAPLAKQQSFSTMVYQVPEFKGQYE
jgi:ABC-type nitrate/sulfonate/bicarbonate transport system substrate-binding protein